MSYIDLDLIGADDLEFKIGEEYFKVPKALKTDVHFKILFFDEKMKKEKESKNQFNHFVDMIHLLLNQKQEFSRKDIIEKFSPMQMQHIAKIVMGEMNKVEKDPN